MHSCQCGKMCYNHSKVCNDTLLVATQSEINEKSSRYVIKGNAAILQALLY